MEVVDEIIFGINHLRALELMPQYESPLKNQKIASSATLSFGFKIDDVSSLPDGTGFLMTREKDEHMTACTWVHTKWPHMVPKNRILLRVFLGRSNLSNVTELADDELISLARTYLQDIMGVTAEPEVTEISKMNMAMPQYDIGHTERVASLLEKTKHQREGLHFIGMSYEGVGIPDCIQLAKETVKNM
ncbi:FAD-dependent oxidoreductase [Brochothrix thermosphacta]|uniref:FAD-dependent oxidoreductase n=1 Tax=Brochothrix thermosphacta TaxID=2756 RepID=UPI002F95664B